MAFYVVPAGVGSRFCFITTAIYLFRVSIFFNSGACTSLHLAQRLMGIVVQEVGTRSTPASEMVIKSFLSWEREIRKELTEPAWEVSELKSLLAFFSSFPPKAMQMFFPYALASV